MTTFEFTANNLNRRERRKQRIFEIIPGLTSWSILIGMAVMAFTCPLAAAVIIIAFYLYWLLRLLYMMLFLVFSYARLKAEEKSDWMARIRGINDIDRSIDAVKKLSSHKDRGEKASLLFFRKQLEELRRKGGSIPLVEDIYHLVIIPVAKETKDIVEPGVRSLAGSIFPPEKILVVMALEERASAEVSEGVAQLKKVYGDKFMDMLVAVHPDGIVGEARGKGANATFAAKKAAEYFKEKKIPLENITSSCFDSDTVINPDYFASLTYYFLTCPKRQRASFQPVPVYNNNIWEAPGITRVLEIGSSFYQLIEATNPEKLVTFSSHSMSFKALVEVGYWPVDMISDDSAIFWKAFMHYNGDYRVVPMYTTLSMDAVVAENWRQTVINVYKQKRRWAWGVENFPIVMRGFLHDKKMPLFSKLKCGFKLFEGHIAWTTWAFLLTILGWLPAIFAGRVYSHSVFYYSVPRITGVIFNLATLSLVTSVVLSLCLLPKTRIKHPILKRIGFALQWLLVPFTFIFLSAIPALDAQTRLMLGKYMTFWVTDKGKKKVDG